MLGRPIETRSAEPSRGSSIGRTLLENSVDIAFRNLKVDVPVVSECLTSSHDTASPHCRRRRIGIQGASTQANELVGRIVGVHVGVHVGDSITLLDADNRQHKV